jgi:hypothetical protein
LETVGRPFGPERMPLNFEIVSLRFSLSIYNQLQR